MAVLDLGTNTFNLLIGECTAKGNEVKPLFMDRVPVKLGKEGFREGRIAEAAQERGVKAIEQHLASVHHWQCDEMIAIGTSGIRSASNGEEFLKKIRERTGLGPEIIDGEREAELIGEGVRAAVPLGREPALILDIGGGSSEFLIGDQESFFWKRSFDIGAARMLNEIAPSDPIAAEEYRRAKAVSLRMLEPLKSALDRYPVKTLIGCSGSFETISDMAHHRFEEAEDPEGKPAVEVSLSHYRSIHEVLLRSTLEERKRMKGMAEMRAELIILGSILIETVIELTGIDRLYSSYYSLRVGALKEFARKRSNNEA